MQNFDLVLQALRADDIHLQERFLNMPIRMTKNLIRGLVEMDDTRFLIDELLVNMSVWTRRKLIKRLAETRLWEETIARIFARVKTIFGAMAALPLLGGCDIEYFLGEAVKWPRLSDADLYRLMRQHGPDGAAFMRLLEGTDEKNVSNKVKRLSFTRSVAVLRCAGAIPAVLGKPRPFVRFLHLRAFVFLKSEDLVVLLAGLLPADADKLLNYYECDGNSICNIGKELYAGKRYGLIEAAFQQR